MNLNRCLDIDLDLDLDLGTVALIFRDLFIKAEPFPRYYDFSCRRDLYKTTR